MIAHLKGRLKRKDEHACSVQIDVNGVWYEVELPAFVWRSIESLEEESPIELEIFYYVTSNNPIPRLIGFQREIERVFFKKLIDVPRVGPSVAARALVFSVSTIARWIEQEDTVSLRGLPGIAQRTADTIVAHLRGKVVEEALLADERYDQPPALAHPSDVARDAIEALVALGYTRTEADRLVQQAEADGPASTVEEALRAVFRKLNTGNA
jgi:holliday junction DNA helicase RuvA